MFGRKRHLEIEAVNLFCQLQKTVLRSPYRIEDVVKLEAAVRLINAEPKLQIAFILTVCNELRKIARPLHPSHKRHRLLNLNNHWWYPQASVLLVRRLLRKQLPFLEAEMVDMVESTAGLKILTVDTAPYLELLIDRCEHFVSSRGKNEELDAALARLEKALSHVDNAPETKLRMRVEKLLEGPGTPAIVPGEAWSDQAIADIEAMAGPEREMWLQILNHTLKASGSQPAAKWLTTASAMLEAVGPDQFAGRVSVWFPLGDKPRTRAVSSWPEWQPNPNLLICETNVDILKGLAWFSGLIENRDLARGLTELALSAYKKIPGAGPRAVKIGNACIYALGAMPGLQGLNQLAILKVRVRPKSAVKSIEKYLNTAAARLDVPVEELEEMSVPGYGLTGVGLLRETIGDYTAELQVTGTHSTQLRWLRPDGKDQKSVPAAIKEHHAADLKELKDAARDIQKMLPAQRDRLDRLFIQNKTWPYATWKERYLDHPLLGFLARRIIWTFCTGSETTAAIFHDGRLVDVTGRPLSGFNDKTTVALWHPIEHSVDTIMQWRRLLEEYGVPQPFKQAHREVYYLTDAERDTAVYSNRYAGHIVKQHQFNSLCAVRGWHNVLKLLVDAEFPPASLKLPQWQMRVEFWTDGAGDDYGTDTNETGTFYYLSTDQVRFLPLDAPQTMGHASDRGQQQTADPLRLEQVPPLVFSEVMRDIDLFVGVASVGNDPTWSDGGPEGRFREYWQSYSFGDLSATAETRKEILQQLIPRLKIRERCALDGKFLVVRGDLHTYKIHIGSSNILMSPHDQYLCIVAGRSAGAGGDKLVLPFEGDNTLAIIISKALLLAEDTRITDPAIANQIRRP